MSQIISRPIYIQPTYTLHCNHVPAQQGGWTGKTSLESITDLSISCGALGFIRRMVPNSNMHPLHVKEFITAGLYSLHHKRLPPLIFDLLQQFLQQGLRFRPHQSICPRLVIQFFTSPSQIGNASPRGAFACYPGYGGRTRIRKSWFSITFYIKIRDV